MGGTSQKTVKDLTANGGSPLKKAGRKVLVGQKLLYSPRSKLPNMNKVYVVGTKFGIILLRTERQNNKDDAFTHTAIQMIEDDDTGVASRLNLIKICSRRQSQLIDKAILQSTSYHSQWFVSIVEAEEKNTNDYRREHAEKFITFLNAIDWKYPQQFAFTADETKVYNGKIAGSLDMYLLNNDIAFLLKQYVFEDLGNLLEDADAIKDTFGPNCTKDQARDYLKEIWIKLSNDA
jgi:hypothetical protein